MRLGVIAKRSRNVLVPPVILTLVARDAITGNVVATVQVSSTSRVSSLISELCNVSARRPETTKIVFDGRLLLERATLRASGLRNADEVSVLHVRRQCFRCGSVCDERPLRFPRRFGQVGHPPFPLEVIQRAAQCIDRGHIDLCCGHVLCVPCLCYLRWLWQEDFEEFEAQHDMPEIEPELFCGAFYMFNARLRGRCNSCDARRVRRQRRRRQR